MVVVEPPAFDDNSGLVERGEDLLVQALVAKEIVEAFDEAVLMRFAGRNVMQFDASAVGLSSTARLAISVALSLPIVAGRPRGKRFGATHRRLLASQVRQKAASVLLDERIVRYYGMRRSK